MRDAAQSLELARDIRRLSLDMISVSGASHLGSVFSAAEILAVLYGDVMRVKPLDPAWSGRDRFVMSKGHAAAGLYATLALAGFFPKQRLGEFYVDGGTLPGHVTHKGIPGVEASTGALGHGLAMGVGLATGARRRCEDWQTFVLLSDGECDEGSTWEAALLAPAWQLGNLTVVVDYNKIQSLGRVEEVLPLEPFADKWLAFGWETVEVDGHDPEELSAALTPTREGPTKPRCVIAHTVKGKGVTFMEDLLLWHYRCPKDEEYAAAVKELEGES